MSINSHYFQRALLKRIFGNKKIYRHQFPSGKIDFMNVDHLGSKHNLFYGDEDSIKNLESKMNNTVENNIFQKVIKADKDKEIIISYDDSIQLRKYLLITYYRVKLNSETNSLKKKEITDIIDSFSNDNYKLRFEENSNPIIYFFMQNSFLKFVRHQDISMIWPQNYFLNIPFDIRHTNNGYVSLITNGLPGFLFRIDKENSIIVANTSLYREFIKTLSVPNNNVTTNLKMRINTFNTSIWFLNKNKVIYPDGSEKLAFYQGFPGETESAFFKRISERDKTKYKYKYPIEKMNNMDYEILILDNMMKFIALQTKLKVPIETYFLNYSQITILFKKWTDIEKIVNSVNPKDVNYWNKTKELQYKHKIWELMLNDQIGYINNFFESINKIKK